LIMERKNKQLQLQYAAQVYSKSELTAEEKDIKILYDACLKG